MIFFIFVYFLRCCVGNFSITQLHARIDATNDRKARIERELQDCNDSLSQLQETQQQQPNEPTESTASQKNQYVM